MQTIFNAIKRKPEGKSAEEIFSGVNENERVTVIYKSCEAVVKEEIDKRDACDTTKIVPSSVKQYKVTVKHYMTKQAVPGFTFMKDFNYDVPMPLTTMQGIIARETPRMFYMELKGFPKTSVKCLRCGKTLTNPVSKLYGIGPECGQHFNIEPMASRDELVERREEIKHIFEEIKWKGWVPKSSIVEIEEVKKDVK